MDSEKHPDFFFFLVGVGWGTEGVGTGGDSPEGKTALSTPTAFPGQPGSKPLSPSHRAAENAHRGYRVGFASAGRGWGSSIGTTKGY